MKLSIAAAATINIFAGSDGRRGSVLSAGIGKTELMRVTTIAYAPLEKS